MFSSPDKSSHGCHLPFELDREIPDESSHTCHLPKYGGRRRVGSSHPWPMERLELAGEGREEGQRNCLVSTEDGGRGRREPWPTRSGVQGQRGGSPDGACRPAEVGVATGARALLPDDPAVGTTRFALQFQKIISESSKNLAKFEL